MRLWQCLQLREGEGLRVRQRQALHLLHGPREVRLLLLFAARPDEVISRDELLNSCWGLTYYGTTRTLDQHILVLRKKLGPEGRRLMSVRSLGYKFAASL